MSLGNYLQSEIFLEEVPPETLHRARWTVCGAAEDAAEATMFMRMLGLLRDHPA